jgi:outer membrane biosynthesis protein TonB
MATDDQGNTYSKVIMDAAANIPVIKAMVVAGKAASKVAEKVKDMLDDDKIVPKKKPPPDIKPKPKPEPDIKPKLKPKPPRDERAKRNPFRLSSDRQPGIETANTKAANPRGLKPPSVGMQGRTLRGEGRLKEYAKGGEVKEDKSPNSGMITQRGWGASRKT